jgi:biopolymer transport protein ExbD
MTALSRRQDGGAGGAGGVSLPITPMLDMSFQLLFFFITTFKLPLGMEGEMSLALPHDGDHGGPVAGPVALAELPSEITIALTSEARDQSADGVGALTLVERSGETSLPYDKGLKELREKLAEIALKSGPDQVVRVRGDEKVKWRGVVKVMDACRSAGFLQVAFAEPPDAVGR